MFCIERMTIFSFFVSNVYGETYFLATNNDTLIPCPIANHEDSNPQIIQPLSYLQK